MEPNKNNEARKVKLNKFGEMMKTMPLESQLRIGLSMADYDNWHDGEYEGDGELIERQLNSVINTIERWKENNFSNPIRK